MVESPRERYGFSALALCMISTAAVLTLVLSLSCTRKHPAEPDYPVIGAGPDSLSFTAIAGGATPPAQSIAVSNIGGGTLDFTVTRRSSWLQVFYRGTAPDTIEVFAYALGLLSGVHVDTVFIRSSGAINSLVKIPISLNVLPGISVSPSSFARTAYRHGPPVGPETLLVTSDGGGPKIYQVSPTPDWLVAGYPVGLATERIVVNFRPEVVSSGIYTHELVISSEQAANLTTEAICSLSVESWRPRFGLDHIVLTDIAFTTRQNGWAVGYERVFDGLEGVIFKSEDSGESWRSVNIPRLGALSGLTIVDGDRLWMPSDTGMLLLMIGGSVQLRALATRENLTDVAFPCQDTGWVTGESGEVFRSIDGGATWIRQATTTEESLNAVAFIDSETGWAVGSKGVIIATTDGGETWQPFVPGPEAELNDIAVSPTGAVWVVGSGGTVLYRAWSGVKWTQIPSGVTDNLRKIAFASAELGWIVGSGGTILQTADGGMGWHRQVSLSSEALFGVFPLDSNRVFVSGNDALILDTYSGGE